MYKFTAKSLFIPVISLSMLACGGQGETKEAVWALVPSGELISLPLDDQTPNVSVGLEYFQAGQPLLFNANWNTNSLQIYDLEAQALKKELVFDREGDQGAALGHFHVHRLDSIFVFPEMSRFVILTDTSGKVKNRIRFTLPDQYPMIFPHNSYYVSPPVVRGKELIVRVRSGRRASEISQEDLNDKKLLAAINLEDGSTRLLPFGFPQDYLATGQKQLEFSAVRVGDQTAVSFMGDHRVYFSGSADAPLQAKPAKSQYLDETMPSFGKDVDGRGFNEYAFAKSRYESLVYDPYRQVYYRFAYPTVPVESDDQLRALRTSPGDFVVMVLSEELEVLTERKFEAGSYLPSNFFVGEKGLYLSINHPDNPANKEDEFAFELIQLKK